MKNEIDTLMKEDDEWPKRDPRRGWRECRSDEDLLSIAPKLQFKAGDTYATFNKQTIEAIKRSVDKLRN